MLLLLLLQVRLAVLWQASTRPLVAGQLVYLHVLLLLLQVNHLGPYTLTRLLEKKLVASKARVVNVVSVTHRITTIK
jgi:NAD(P)-dependent dehydrogenase (short-subunit alcohol dehydrogenase family)